MPIFFVADYDGHPVFPVPGFRARMAIEAGCGAMIEDTVTLYRPVGSIELDLVRQSGFRRWPPRLPEQPFFYPVTNERYAIEIASRWSTQDGGTGYVTRFQVRKPFVDRYRIHTVGDTHHTEWWIPAEDLAAMNENIVGLIQVIGEYSDGG